MIFTSTGSHSFINALEVTYILEIIIREYIPHIALTSHLMQTGAVTQSNRFIFLLKSM